MTSPNFWFCFNNLPYLLSIFMALKRDGICPVQGTCTSPISLSFSEQEKQALFSPEKTCGLTCASQDI